MPAEEQHLVHTLELKERGNEMTGFESRSEEPIKGGRQIRTDGIEERTK